MWSFTEPLLGLNYDLQMSMCVSDRRHGDAERTAHLLRGIHETRRRILLVLRSLPSVLPTTSEINARTHGHEQVPGSKANEPSVGILRVPEHGAG